MNTYKIHKIVSTGKRGKLQITTMFEGKSVTRHIVNGVGRHPDDTLPKQYSRVMGVIDDLTKEINRRAEWLAEVELPKNRDKVDKDQVKVVTSQKQAYEMSLLSVQEELNYMQQEDPLQVRYVVGGEDE